MENVVPRVNVGPDEFTDVAVPGAVRMSAGQHPAGLGEADACALTDGEVAGGLGDVGLAALTGPMNDVTATLADASSQVVLICLAFTVLATLSALIPEGPEARTEHRMKVSEAAFRPSHPGSSAVTDRPTSTECVPE